jgi:hypothetical protein
MISDKGKNLVFLLSLPRSGSTIASLVLGNHSKIYCPPEPWFLLKLSVLTKTGNPYSPYDDNLATKAAFDFLKEEQFLNAVRSFAITAYNDHLRSSGKSIFVDKTPRYYHILPFIEALFPDAKKIWLKRNPLDVAASYKEAWGIEGDIITGQHYTPASFDFGMGLFNLSSFFEGRRKNCLEVMYEEFTESPKDALYKICKFLAIPYEKDMIDIHNNPKLISQYKASSFGDKEATNKTTIHATSVGHWRERLSRSEVQTIIDLIGVDVISRMGYPIRSDLKKYGVRIPTEKSARSKRKKLLSKSIHNLDSLESIAEERLAELKVKEESLNHLGQQLTGKDKEILNLKSVADERLLLLKKMEGTDLQLKEKEIEILALKAVAEERLRLFKKTEGSDRQLKEKEKEIHDLKSVADERLRLITEMEGTDRQLKEKEKEIITLKDIAEKRTEALTEKEKEISATHKSAEDRARALTEKEKEIATLKDVAENRAQALTEKEKEISSIHKVAEDRFRALTEKEKHIASLQRIAEDREGELKEKERLIEEVSREAEKRLAEMQKMVNAMQERESAIAMLHQIAEERLREMLNKEKEISRLLELDQREKAELEEFKRKLGEEDKELGALMAELIEVKKCWGYKLSQKWNSILRKRSKSLNTK